MAMKGFVRTLEAVIASVIFITFISTAVTMIETGDMGDDVARNSVQTTLNSYTHGGEVRGNLTPENIENILEPHKPSGFQSHVRVGQTEKTRDTGVADEEILIDKEGSSGEILFWIKEANSLTITFNDEVLIEDTEMTGYYETHVGSTSGYLNFTGSGSADFEFHSTQWSGNTTLPDTDVSVANRLVAGQGFNEVQVSLWQE